MERLGPNQRRVVRELRRRPSATIRELCDVTGLEYWQARAALLGLEHRQMVHFTSTTYPTRWGLNGYGRQEARHAFGRLNEENAA